MDRRSFLTGLVSALAAPAIVRASSIMPIRTPPLVLAAIDTVVPQSEYSVITVRGWNMYGEPMIETYRIPVTYKSDMHWQRVLTDQLCYNPYRRGIKVDIDDRP